MSNNIESEKKHHSINLLEKKVTGSNPPKISSSFNNSIRRSMSSADMSSQKLIEFPLKRVQSSERLLEEEKKAGSGGAAFDDIWSSILSQKKPEDESPAPYVHPLVKRASSLSEKSLEICTESLGSETGSDGFSFPISEPEVKAEAEADAEAELEHETGDCVEVVKYNYQVINKKRNDNGVVRSFPPPLPSLANRDDGSNLQMRTRRQDGRLVVEAVTVPSRNCFHARREDGRLLLTLTNDIQQQERFDDGDDEKDDEDLEEKVVEDVEKDLALVVEGNSRLPTAKMINVQIMTKVLELTSTRNMSTWPRGSNRAVITSLDEGDDDVPEKQTEVKILRPLPSPRSGMSTATTAADMLNAYEYYWRRSDSPTAAAVAVLKPLAGKQNSYPNTVSVSPQVVKDGNRINKFLLSHNLKGGQQERVVLVKAAAVGEEYMIPILRGCKEPKRSLYFLEPFCIATS